MNQPRKKIHRPLMTSEKTIIRNPTIIMSIEIALLTIVAWAVGFQENP